MQKTITEMEIDFENIDYLKTGNNKQRLAYATLTKYKFFTILQQFDPILAGTIPINIDIENSDLDIICYCNDQVEFMQTIKDNFSDTKGFKIIEFNQEEISTVLANFWIDDFEIEIFGQNIPTRQQYAFRHMIVENKLLLERDEAFRDKIIDLKRQGHKTEPAFGIALGLVGNPYIELLTYE